MSNSSAATEENARYGSDVELQDHGYNGDGIRVNTEVKLTVGEELWKHGGNAELGQGFKNREMGSKAQVSRG